MLHFMSTAGGVDIAGVVGGGATVVFDEEQVPTTQVPADSWKQAEGGQE